MDGKFKIQVGLGRDGKYFAFRTYMDTDPDTDTCADFVPHTSFRLEQQDGEFRAQFEERVRQEARRRGINYVKWLD